MSGQARQVAQRRFLPHRGCRRARELPPLLAVSTRDRTRDAGVACCCGDRRTRTAAHRARIPGRWQARRGSRRYAWDDDPTSAPTVRAARRCVADRGRNDPARSARETTGGRDHDADVLDRVRGGACKRSAIQRRVSRRVSTAANGRSQSQPWAEGRSERCQSVGSAGGWPGPRSLLAWRGRPRWLLEHEGAPFPSPRARPSSRLSPRVLLAVQLTPVGSGNGRNTDARCATVLSRRIPRAPTNRPFHHVAGDTARGDHRSRHGG